MAAFAVRREPTAFANDKSSKATASFKDAAHLAFIRNLPSVVSGEFGCEAAHIRTGSAQHNKKKTGGSQKSSDCWTLPLTPDEHREQHGMNEMEFWRRHGIDPFQVADALYQATGDIAAATAIILKARKP
jgi:hypothetical protein